MDSAPSARSSLVPTGAFVQQRHFALTAATADFSVKVSPYRPGMEAYRGALAAFMARRRANGVPPVEFKLRLTPGNFTAAPRDLELSLRARRDALGYGLWVTKDGREVIFCRKYKPLLERVAGGEWRIANRFEWIKNIICQEFFYCESWPGSPLKTKQAQAVAAMQALGAPVPDLPMPSKKARRNA